MTTLQETAMLQALEVLENGNRSPITTAANILRTALAQQGEQPVAWMTRYGNVARADAIKSGIPFDDREDYTIPLYTAAPAPQPAQGLPFIPWSKEAEMRESWQSAQPVAPTVCDLCATDGKCMNRSMLCKIMLTRLPTDDTEGGAP